MQLRSGYILVLIVFLLLGLQTNAQSRKELEERRVQLNEDIEKLDELLKSTRKDRKNAVTQVTTLQSQIDKREQLIYTISNEVNFLEESLKRNEEVIEALTEDIKRLEVDYVFMIRNAYRHRGVKSRLLFLFSASSFNNAFQRWQYLKRYDDYRKNQATAIIRTRESLAKKVSRYEENKYQKQSLLQAEECQREILETELIIKDKMLGRLKSDERQIMNDLEAQKMARQKLFRKVTKVIASNTELKEENSAEEEEIVILESELTSKFGRRKGKLPWPVEQGVITNKYGKQQHPLYKAITTFNSGINIKATGSPEVRAVFNGEVIDVFSVPGNENAIMIRHGDYFTVYSNLSETLVEPGDIVRTKQTIGQIKEKNGELEVHFEVWKSKDRQNPSSWIAKR